MSLLCKMCLTDQHHSCCMSMMLEKPSQFCFDKHIFKRFSFSMGDQGRFLEYLSEIRLVLNSMPFVKYVL